jgi:hypothetical protein
MAGRLDFASPPVSPRRQALFNHLVIRPIDKIHANHDRKPHPGRNKVLPTGGNKR